MDGSWAAGARPRSARALDILARRPQMQERLTVQLADALVESIRPKGVGVILGAESSIWEPSIYACHCEA